MSKPFPGLRRRDWASTRRVVLDRLPYAIAASSPSDRSQASCLKAAAVRCKPQGDSETIHQPTRTINSHRFGGQFKSLEVSECVAGTSADCAAICCCCPFSLLHLLALLFLKIPAIVVRKIIFNLKKKLLKRKTAAGGEEGVASWTPSWSCKERFKSEDVLQSSGDLLDQEFLREYFCCKQLGFGNQELFEHAIESDENKICVVDVPNFCGSKS